LPDGKNRITQIEIQFLHEEKHREYDQKRLIWPDQREKNIFLKIRRPPQWNVIRRGQSVKGGFKGIHLAGQEKGLSRAGNPQSDHFTIHKGEEKTCGNSVTFPSKKKQAQGQWVSSDFF